MKESDKKKLNGAVVFQCVLLAGIVAILACMLFADLFGNYLHPRFYPFIVCSFVFLTILFLSRLPYLFAVRSETPLKLKYFLCLGFIILFFVSSRESIDSALAGLRGVTVDDSTYYAGNGESNQKAGNGPADTMKGPGENSQNDSGPAGEKNSDTPNKSTSPPGMIIADYTSFVPVLNEVFTFPEKYRDFTIVIRGFKFSSRELPSGRFVIARLVITCCAADAQPAGIVCEYGDHLNLKENGWYELVGVLCIEEGWDQFGEKCLWPFIKVQKHAAVSSPRQTYLFLN